MATKFTVTQYGQLAADFMKALTDIGAIVPPVDPAEVSTLKFARGHANIPDRFCSTAILSVERVPELAAVNKLDVEMGRDTLQFLEAFRAVLDAGDAILQDLRIRLMVRKASLASQSLQIYDIAKGLARDPLATQAAAHVADMKRDLGRHGLTKAQRDARTKAAAKAEKEVQAA